MTSRRKVSWFDENGTPRGGWQEIPEDSRDDGLFPEHDQVLLYRALEALTSKQRFVIECNWGLGGRGQSSLREIAEFMGISHVAALNVYERAMERLRGLTVGLEKVEED